MMNKWDNIPNEILRNITEHLGYVRQSQWKYVNRQWLNMFQTKSYKSISVKLEPSNKTLLDILYSPLNPGLFVKKARIKIICIPPHPGQSNVTDLLYHLMLRCPYVNKIHLAGAECQHWAYFLQILLLSNNGWSQISYLEPTFMNDDSTYLCYLNCAIYLKKTLLSLSLKQDTIRSSNNLEFLTGFESLKELIIMDGNILTKKIDREMIVQNFPSSISSLTVINTQPNSLSVTTDVNEFDPTLFSNIKELKVVNFDTQSDYAFLQLIKEFPHIHKLTLAIDDSVSNSVIINSFTRKDKVGIPILHDFFNYIHTIASVEIALLFINTDVFLQQYYSYHSNRIYQEKPSVINQAYFQQTISDTIDQENFPQVLTNDYLRHKVEIEIEKGQTKINAYFGNSLQIWQLNNRVIEKVLFYGTNLGEPIPVIDIGRLISSHQNLRRLTLQEGPFQLHLPDDTSENLQSTVEELELLNVTGVNPNALVRVFSFLKLFHLGYMDFFIKRNIASNSCFLDLPNTIVDVFKLTYFTYSSSSSPTLIVRLHYKDKCKTRYLTCDLQTQYEIDCQRFQLLSNSTDVVILGATFKSINKFIFCRSRIHYQDPPIILSFD